MSRRAVIWSVFCNLLNFILVTICVAGFFVSIGDGNMQVAGAVCFRYFTVDSNVLSALVCLMLVIFCLCRRAAVLPEWLRICKLVSTTAVMVTMLTVLCFLGPIYGYASMFEGKNLFLHGICPLLSLLSFVLAERGELLSGPAALWGTVPVAVYGTVYFVQVVFRGAWPDFYAFNAGGRWYLSCAVMLTATTLLALLLRRLNGRRRPPS